MTPQAYIDAGFRVIPVGPDKRPKMSGFSADNPTFTAAPADFGPEDSVGVLCGPCGARSPEGHWLVCLDLDGAPPDWALDHDTLVTHNGRHAWYWVPSDCGLKQWGDALRTKASEGWALDVRFAGGYAREVGDFDPERIDVMPEQWLERIKEARRKPEGEAVTGARSDLHDIDERLALWLVEVLEAGWPDAGHGRHDCALALGGTLRRLGVPLGQARDIASAVLSTRSEAPTARLQAVTDAWQAADEGRPAKGAGELCRLVKNASPVQEVLDRIEFSQPIVVERKAQPEQPNEKSECADREVNPWVAATVDADWITDPDIAVDWVISRLVATGEPTLLVAAAGAGKTTATISMGLHVAAGRTLWGRFSVPRPGRVVHIDYEQQKSLRRSYQEIAKGAGIDLREVWANVSLIPAMPPGFLVEMRNGGVDTKARRELVENLVELCTGARLCIVNSLVASTPGVDENSKDISDALTLLGEVGNRTGCAMLMIHHCGRNTNGHARGHSSIEGVVQTELRVDRPDEDGNATEWRQTKDRLGEGRVKPFRLEWTRDPEAGTQTLVAADVEAQAPNHKDPSTTRERIRDAILSMVEKKVSVTITEIKGGVRGDDKVKRDVAAQLVEEGILRLDGKLYSLAQAPTHAAGTQHPTTHDA